jgi:hypothetical protein
LPRRIPESSALTNRPCCLRILVLLGLLYCLPLQAGPRWFAIYLGDAHIGYLQRERSAQQDSVETRSELSLLLQRNGETLQVRSAERHLERADGMPLAFSSRFETAGTLAAVDAEVIEGQIHARIQQGEQIHRQNLPWPDGAVLADGQHRALRQLLWEGHASVEVLAFDPASLSALPLRSERLGLDGANPPGEERPLLRVRQRHGDAKTGVNSELWLDPTSGELVQMRLPALGLELMLRACSRECASAAPQGVDVLANTLLDAPRSLSRGERERPLWFEINAGNAALDPLERIPGQRLHREQSGAGRLRVDPSGASQPAPTDADLQPGRWLQSDHPEVREMARSAAGRSRDPARQMQRLEQAVRRHIRHKSLRVGYASALEVIQLKEGDCTEHAVLLAALARARGIPARVVTGLAYTRGYAGRSDVFVPHAWVMAWVNGRWRGYDAALPSFGAAHLGLSIGNGEPFDFYGGLELMGRLRVSAIESERHEEGP